MRVAFIKLSIETLKKLWKWTADLPVSFNWSDVDKIRSPRFIFGQSHLFLFTNLFRFAYAISTCILTCSETTNDLFWLQKQTTHRLHDKYCRLMARCHDSGMKDRVSYIWIISSNSKFAQDSVILDMLRTQFYRETAADGWEYSGIWIRRHSN